MKRIGHIRRPNGLRAIIIVPVLMVMALVLAATLSCSSMQEGKVDIPKDSLQKKRPKKSQNI